MLIGAELAYGHRIVGDNAGPAWTWTDITDMLELGSPGGIATVHGRQDPTASISTGSCTLQIKDPNRELYADQFIGVPLRVWIDLEQGAGRYYRHEGEIVSATSVSSSAGRHYIEVTSQDILGYLADTPQQDSVLRSTVVKAPSIRAYWPMEDDSGATSIGSYFGGRSGILSGGASPGGTRITGALRSLAMTSDGRASFSLTDTTVPTTQWSTTWAAFIPSTTTGTVILGSVFTTGTVRRWDYTYTVSTNVITLKAYNNSGTEVLGSPGTTITMFSPTDAPVLLSINVSISGGNLACKIGMNYRTTSGSAYGQSISNNVAGTIGYISSISFANSSGLADYELSHLAAWDSDPVGDAESFVSATTGYNGDTFNNRVARIAAAVDTTYTVAGGGDARYSIGPYPSTGNLLDIIHDTENADSGGLIFGARNSLGLRGISRYDRYNKASSITIDASDGGDVLSPFTAVVDKSLIKNQWTISRQGGSSATARDDESIEIFGLRPESDTLNLVDDSRLYDIASWRVHMSTGQPVRYSALSINLLRNLTLTASWLPREIGDRITVINLPEPHVSTLDLVIEGWAEQISKTSYTVQIYCSLYAPWRVWKLESSTDNLGRIDTAGCLLNADISATDTTIALITAIGPTWTTDPANYPFDIGIGTGMSRECIRLNSVPDGASTPQTFTGVTRSVNGIVRAHAAADGELIGLWEPPVVGL